VERRVAGINLDHRQQRRERLLERQPVPQFLFDEVPDHSLRLRSQHIKRRRRHLLVGRLLQGQQPDLGAIPVRDDQFVLLRDRRQVITREPHVLALIFHRHRLAPAQQRIPAEGHYHSHEIPHMRAVSYCSDPLGRG
jgi:hypothetical protein